MNKNTRPTPVNPTVEQMIVVEEEEEEPSNKTRRLKSSISTNKIFALSLFILLVILIAYILFHGKVTDTKLSQLANSPNTDIKQLLEEINRTLKSIEQNLIIQAKTSNVKD